MDKTPPKRNEEQRSNGPIVRFIGRNRITDGYMFRTLLVLMPYVVVYQLIFGRRARKSWNDTFFQFFRIGVPPSVPDRFELTEELTKCRFVCISDTHMLHDQLEVPDGDVLIHTGDFTCHGSLEEVQAFADWMKSLPHAIKVIVPGNHDMILDEKYYDQYWSDWSHEKQDYALAKKCLENIPNAHLLLDSGCCIHGLNLWGSPWVPVDGATSFNKSDDARAKHWNALLTYTKAKNKKIDMLLTHCPPYGIGDMTPTGGREGCQHLLEAVRILSPKYHIFGHCHSDHGVFEDVDGKDTCSSGTTFINAANVSDFYWLGSRAAICFDVVVD